MNFKEVWLIATFRKGKYDELDLDVEIRKRTPQSLEINQCAYLIRIPYESDDWRKRTGTINLPEVKPPSLQDPRGFKDVGDTVSVLVAKDLPQQVISRMTQ